MLLDTKMFRPYRRKKHYYRQDEMIVHYDYNTNHWQIMLNFEVVEGDGYFPFLRALGNITDQFKEDERIVCYINDLRLAMLMIPEGEIEGSKTDESGKKHPVYYTTNHIEFRNFSLFHISSRGKEAKNVAYMYEYLTKLSERIGAKTINACQYTVGYMSKKALSYGLDKNILKWYRENHNYMDSVKEYEDQLIGCKAGLLKAWEGEHNDVLMIDLKSAYLSAFVQLDCFPIGRKKHYIGKSAMVKFLKGEYYHILITTKDKVEEFSQYRVNKTYGFYKHDFDTFEIIGTDLKELVVEQFKKGATIEVYDAQKYGRLMPEIVDRMMQFYDEKSKATGSDKEAIKALTEMIYGKALQQREFDSDKETYTYFLRPDNYMRPEYSMIACSYTRFRLARMISRLGGSYYNDTDGIECKYTVENEQIVKEENAIIRKLNISLGFVSNIGTWKFEEKHARINIIGRKQRMYYGDNGELTVKVAGINKLDLIKHLKENDVKDPMQYFTSKRMIAVPTYKFDYVNGFSVGEDKYIKIGKDEYYGKVD